MRTEMMNLKSWTGVAFIAAFFAAQNAHAFGSKSPFQLQRGQEATDPAIVATIQSLHAQINAKLNPAVLDISLSSRSGNWNDDGSFEALDAGDLPALKEYAPILAYEWQKYPQDFLLATKIEAIVLAKHLTVSGQHRCAMPDTSENTLVLEVSAACINATDEYVNRVIHHEFYHMIEKQFFGNPYHQDPQFISLNYPGWEYKGGSGKDAYAWGQNHCASELHPAPGFVTCYSTAASEEDKPETFSFLMVGTSRAKLRSWISADPVLNAKANYMGRFMLRISPSMKAILNSTDTGESKIDATIQQAFNDALVWDVQANHYVQKNPGVPVNGFVWDVPSQTWQRPSL